MKHLRIAVLAILVIIFVGFGVTHVKNQSTKLQYKELEIKSNEAKLIELNQRYDNVLQLQTETDKQKEEQLKQIQELEAERERLNGELQAKRQREAEEKEKLATAARRATGTQRVEAAGSCADWIASAGISDTANAIELIRRESGCNPYARNSSSGACGVAQELPCGKSGCSLGDGACQVRWMNGYVKNRYGSWANAVAFHDRNNWY